MVFISPDSSDRAAPMAAAPFVWRPDGRPDWGAMWTSFCDLAIHGGPPHRGIGQALRGSRTAGDDAASDPAMVAEIRRGIWETTGLFAESPSPGWIAVTCESRAMADWLGDAIAPENVEVRVEEDRVLLPAGPRFRLDNEVKSVITVVAKTHHYGAMHGGVVARSDRDGEATRRYGFRCVACGLDFQVSRPDAEANLEATCPVDGAQMARWGAVVARRSAAFWHSHGPGEPYHSHESYQPAGAGRPGGAIPRPLKVGVGGSAPESTVLVDALRRRYGRRRAVVVSPAQATEVEDPAVDLVLVVDETSEPRAFAPAMVDSTIGVFGASALADALDADGRELAAWQLLVVDTGKEAAAGLPSLEEQTCQRRGQRPAMFVDLTTVEGIDVIASWLQRELLLEPWRDRVR
jgi:ribosomal protein L37AE/L43A